VVRFDVTAVACASRGWEYRQGGAADPIRTASLRWLAGIRADGNGFSGRPEKPLPGISCGVPPIFLRVQISAA
jgi:hypothetical protein